MFILLSHAASVSRERKTKAIAVADPGIGPWGSALLFLDQTEARGAEKKIWEGQDDPCPPPPPTPHPPPPSEGLDPLLYYVDNKVKESSFSTVSLNTIINDVIIIIIFNIYIAQINIQEDMIKKLNPKLLCYLFTILRKHDEKAIAKLNSVFETSVFSFSGHELVQYGMQGSGTSSSPSRAQQRRRDWAQGQQEQQQRQPSDYDVSHFFDG